MEEEWYLDILFREDKEVISPMTEEEWYLDILYREDEVISPEEEWSKEDLDNLFGEDEGISGFLQKMVRLGSPPNHIMIQDVDVFNTNPNETFVCDLVTFVVVKQRTESCGRTDGCEAGCWRIIGRDKLLKSKDTSKNRDKVVGFKKILKFCLTRKLPRKYKMSWVMEEYRLTRMQDLVLCKIRCMFQAEISTLLIKHFKTTSELLPNYGSDKTKRRDEVHLLMIEMDGGRNGWPSYVPNNVYNLNPVMLVDPLYQQFQWRGFCFFTNNASLTTHKCDGGYWMVLLPERVIKSSHDGKTIIGFKKVLKFYETTENQRYEPGEKAWIMEEYRLRDKMQQNKLLNVLHQVAFSQTWYFYS